MSRTLLLVIILLGVIAFGLTYQRQMSDDEGTEKTEAASAPSETKSRKVRLPSGLKREDIETVVHDYIMENPKVIIDAVTKFQEQERAQATEGTRKAYSEVKDQLHNDPMSPTIGDPKADVVIVEFFDYNCGACKAMIGALEEVVKEKGVRVVLKEHPIFGAESMALARIAIAVHELDKKKYWPFHVAMMKHQGKMDAAQALATAAKLGLNAEKVKQTAESQKVVDYTNRVVELGQKVQLRGTPLMFVNDEPVPHAITDVAGFKAKIAEARARLAN